MNLKENISDRGLRYPGHLNCDQTARIDRADMTSDEQTDTSRALAIPIVDAGYASATLLLDETLADMLSDGVTMVEACRTLGVKRRAIYERLARDGAFARLLDDARRLGADAIAERTRQISRGVEGVSSGDWRRDKLIIETDMKLLAKWHPKEYGEKLEIRSTNVNANLPISDDATEAARQYRALVGGD